MRAMTFRLRTTVQPMPSRTESASRTRASIICRSFGSSSASSTVRKRCSWPRSRMRLRMRSSMVTRRNHVRAGAEYRDELKHVVVIGSEHWRAGQKLQHRAASVRVKALHRHENRKHAMALAEGSRGFAERRDVAAIFRVHNGAGLVKINCAILAFFVSAGGDARYVFGNGGFHRPNERMDGAKHEDGSFFVPTSFTERLARVFRGMRLECPGSVSTELGGDAEFAQQILRLHVARDDQRIVHVAGAHVSNQWIHVAGFPAVGKGQLIFRGSQTERPDHHGREGVGEFALE